MGGWQGQMISTKLGDELHECYALVRGGIAVIEHYGGENEVRFYYVVHVPTDNGIGYLFCEEYEVGSIVDKIVEMQDWMSVRSSDDILPSTHEAMADFRSRYIFYRHLPPELTLVFARVEDPTAMPAARSARAI